MKKSLLITILVLAIGGSAGGYYLVQKDDGKKASQTSGNTSPAPPPAATPEVTSPPEAVPPKNVCDILTQEVANKVLDASAKASDSNKEAPKDANNVIISTCTYNSADGTKTASLLMRVAKNAEGSAHDKEQFGPNKPSNAQTLAGYGDSAYWDADFKQLNILKGTTWYVITSGPNETQARTLDQAKQLADLIITKL